MDYYTVKDIMRITGCGKNCAYKVISELLGAFKKEYPDVMTIGAKVPSWYVEKKLKNKEV